MSLRLFTRAFEKTRQRDARQHGTGKRGGRLLAREAADAGREIVDGALAQLGGDALQVVRYRMDVGGCLRNFLGERFGCAMHGAAERVEPGRAGDFFSSATERAWSFKLSAASLMVSVAVSKKSESSPRFCAPGPGFAPHTPRG